jgi:hypothetical protein
VVVYSQLALKIAVKYPVVLAGRRRGTHATRCCKRLLTGIEGNNVTVIGRYDRQ